MEHLSRNLPECFLFHASEVGCFDVPVKVYFQELKNNEKIGPELETVNHFNDSISVRVFAHYLLQNPGFNLRIDYVSMSVA